jgi:hypothetical protein
MAASKHVDYMSMPAEGAGEEDGSEAEDGEEGSDSESGSGKDEDEEDEEDEEEDGGMPTVRLIRDQGSSSE